MKKLLPIIIIIIIMGGYLYVKNNPESQISKQIMTLIGSGSISVSTSNTTTTTTTTTSNKLDLTNCTSYFDGCNNCSVKDGKPDACTMMYCETPAEPKCLEYKK